MTKKTLLTGLYLITPDVLDTTLLLTQVEAALKGGARLVQYRNKRAECALEAEQAGALKRLCKTYSALLIINDKPALAALCGADGVHLGQGDSSISAARTLLGPEAIIGVTCHNQLNLAAAALAQGADYLSFGRFFPSQTKPSASGADLALLQNAKQRFDRPIAAIGGITLACAAALIAQGADMLAVCAGVFSHTDIEQQTRAFIRYIG